MRTKDYFELIDIICFSRLNGNILNAGQCITVHQYNNGVINKLSIEIQQKINFIKDKIHSQKWNRPELSYDGDKSLLIREYGNINYKPFKPFLK